MPEYTGYQKKASYNKRDILPVDARFGSETAAKTFAEGLMQDGWVDVKVIRDENGWEVTAKKTIRKKIL